MPRPVPPLHLVTDDHTLGAGEFAARAAELLRRGGGSLALHLRARSFPVARLCELALRLLPVARHCGAALLINSRVDVTLAVDADGAQMGAAGLPLPEARSLLGSARLLGASVHSPAEARDAVAHGADFLITGTLFPSRSHPGLPGTGTAWLQPLRAFGVPVVGIGGVTPERVPEVLAAGACGVAVLGGVWRAEHPLRQLDRYLEALDS